MVIRRFVSVQCEIRRLREAQEKLPAPSEKAWLTEYARTAIDAQVAVLEENLDAETVCDRWHNSHTRSYALEAVDWLHGRTHASIASNWENFVA